MKTELKTVKETLRQTEADFSALKKQAESTNREYDRLAAEFQDLQVRYHH